MATATPNRISQEHALAFMLGGKAVVVLHSMLTGNQYRYKIVKQEDKQDLWYVYSDQYFEDGKRIYIGFIRKHEIYGYYYKPCDTIQWVRVTAPGIKQELFKAMKAMRWTIVKLVEQKVPDELHILHTGLCSVCGRPLKDARSLELGIGPKCRGER